MPESLIDGEGTGVHANVYGVNEHGEIFVTWNDSGTLRFALLSVVSNAVPDSLVLSGGNGVFGVTSAGNLFRTWWHNSHQMEILPHYGGALVAQSLVAGEGIGVHANVYGVNEHGDFFTTWNDQGTIRFALIP